MKRIIGFLAFFFFTAVFSPCLKAQIGFSGSLDSTALFQAGAGDAPAFIYGIEEYANIRMQAKLREMGRFEAAVNFIALAGNYADNAYRFSGSNALPYKTGDNYIAGIELERLYFRLNFQSADLDAGLLRIPFGYSQVWGPSDFLNPKNPLKPDARPRAVLGAGLALYPGDQLKLLGFGAAPRDPLQLSGSGGFAGISMNYHWSKVSLEALYSYESPQTSSGYGKHRNGISVKADIKAGFVMDALYTYNHEAATEFDGLSFSAGIDYSFFNGNLIALAEYLYNGAASSTALGFNGSFSNRHYLFTGFTWRFSDFTNIDLALISGFDDISFTPIASFNHSLFQGAALGISAQIPLDRDLFFQNRARGELGPIPPDYLQPWKDPGNPGSGKMYSGRYFDLSVKLKLKF
jgi:hypothetical protein